MSILNLTDASLSYGDELLLDHAFLAVEEGERICLLGRNGSGKSSLLSVLWGRSELDFGTVTRRGELKTALLSQQPEAYTQGSAYGLCARALGAHGELLARYFETEDESVRAELAPELERYDLWAQDAKLRKMLNKMGIEAHANLKELSGGYRRRAALAAALCSEPELLLLDEPTNHLDIETVTWFEQYLSAFTGTIIFVTHDRRFADDLATRIVELDRGQLYSYPGSFTAYLHCRAERLRMEQLHNERQDRILSEEEAWIRRGVKARLARNEGRVRNLEQLRAQRRNRRNAQGKVIMEINEADRSGNIVLDIRELSHSLGGQLLLDNFSSTVMRGDRIGIVGRNGCGKTTLIRLLMHELKPDHGYVRQGMNTQLVYFDQYHEQLKLQRSARDNVAEGLSDVVINGKKRSVLSYLSNFLFTPRRAQTPAGALSGGEQNRLLLARLFAKPSNLLILDEPTNDLDLETLELLEELLADYPGTIIVISHDRAFIDHVATETWVFEEGGHLEKVVGGWREYQSFCASRQSAALKSTTAAARRPAPDTATQRGTAKARTGLSFTEKYELKGLPARIEEVESELSAIDKALSEPDLYSDGADKALKLQAQREHCQQALDTLYARWESLESRAAE